MEKIVEHGLLYDFYGELLTEHQRQIYEDAVYHDMSVSEIADIQGISRQGVHDLIRRCDKILEQYEARLGLVKKFERVRERVRRIDALAERLLTENGDMSGESCIRQETGAQAGRTDVPGGRRFCPYNQIPGEIRRLSDEILEEL